MGRKTLLTSVILAMLLLPLSAAAEPGKVCEGGACFEKEIEIGGQKVPLIGVAKFEYMFFDVYTLALYGPSSARTSAEILKNVPKRLVFHYHRDIKRTEMIEGADKNLDANPNVVRAALKPKLDQINAWYVNVSDDDRYALTFEPGVGLSLSHNGELKGTIPGDDFGNTYLGIWLSEHPLSEDLRDSLLRGS